MTPDATRHWLNINRAPVLTLWAVMIAERLGFKRSEALTLGRAVPVRREETGMHALKDSKPISPEGVERYLESKFADALNDTREAMQELADAFPPLELQRVAFELYEQFRPASADERLGTIIPASPW